MYIFKPDFIKCPVHTFAFIKYEKSKVYKTKTRMWDYIAAYEVLDKVLFLFKIYYIFYLNYI